MTEYSMPAATRDLSQIPYSSDSVFNLPLGSNAQWEANDQLSGARVFVNTTTSGYNQNIYASDGSDPVVTVFNNAAAGGTPETFQAHIPADAVPSPGNDRTLAVDDTTSGTWFSFGGFNWTGGNTATVTQGSAQSDSGSGIEHSGSNYDEAVGTLRQSDLEAGVINHMLRIQLPTEMLKSYSNSISELAPHAWPQTQEDGFAINGKGGTPYSGTVPFGVTLGIPANAVEPSDVKNNAGADMLWHALQTHGAMIRDSAGSGNTVTLQADQDVDHNDPLIQGMDTLGSQIMESVRILTNQGPNSINGGGTSIAVPSLEVSGQSASESSALASTQQGDKSDGAGSVSSATSGDNGAGTSGTGTGGTDAGGTAADQNGSTTGTTDASSNTTAASGTDAGGTAADQNGDSAAITQDALSSGQGSSGGSSGMSFVNPPGSGGTGPGTATAADGTTSDSGSGGGSGSASDVSSAGGLGAASSSDFTPPASSSGSSWSHRHGASGAGHGVWWTNHHSQSAIPAHHG
jgi:hypothetical protein